MVALPWTQVMQCGNLEDFMVLTSGVSITGRDGALRLTCTLPSSWDDLPMTSSGRGCKPE